MRGWSTGAWRAVGALRLLHAPLAVALHHPTTGMPTAPRLRRNSRVGSSPAERAPSAAASSALTLAAPPAAAAPRVVFVRLTLLALRSIDTPSQTWQGDCAYQFVFAYPRPSAAQGAEEVRHAQVLQDVLDHAHTEKNRERAFEKLKDLQGIFWPELSDVCDADEGHAEVWVSRLRQDKRLTQARLAAASGLHTQEAVSSHNFVSFQLRTRQRLSQRFQLALFPFDSQLLRARIVLRQDATVFRFATRAESERVLQDDCCPRFINAVNGASSPVLAEWDLMRGMVAVACQSQPKMSRSNLQYPVYKTFLLVHRQWSYHMYTLILPLLGILFLSLLTFQLDENKYDRFVVLTSLVFPAFQLKSQVSSLLPLMGIASVLDLMVVAGAGFVLWVVLLNFLDSRHTLNALLWCKNEHAALTRQDFASVAGRAASDGLQPALQRVVELWPEGAATAQWMQTSASSAFSANRTLAGAYCTERLKGFDSDGALCLHKLQQETLDYQVRRRARHATTRAGAPAPTRPLPLTARARAPTAQHCRWTSATKTCATTCCFSPFFSLPSTLSLQTRFGTPRASSLAAAPTTPLQRTCRTAPCTSPTPRRLTRSSRGSSGPLSETSCPWSGRGPCCTRACPARCSSACAGGRGGGATATPCHTFLLLAGRSRGLCVATSSHNTTPLAGERGSKAGRAPPSHKSSLLPLPPSAASCASPAGSKSGGTKAISLVSPQHSTRRWLPAVTPQMFMPLRGKGGGQCRCACAREGEGARRGAVVGAQPRGCARTAL